MEQGYPFYCTFTMIIINIPFSDLIVNVSEIIIDKLQETDESEIVKKYDLDVKINFFELYIYNILNFTDIIVEPF